MEQVKRRRSKKLDQKY